MSAYYNEFDKPTAAWLRELIKRGLIADGEVDERSITDVSADDLSGFTQVHLFAGIGGWSRAFRLAGISDNDEAWSLSCPCQPFSQCGKQMGEADPRHLWPIARELMRSRQPAIAFGEQVSSPLGREWLAGVFADLEELEYQPAGADLCAAGVGAPHPRQRLYWVANSTGKRCDWINPLLREEVRRKGPAPFSKAARSCENRNPEGLGDASSSRLEGQWSEYSPSGERCSGLVGFAVQAGVPQWNGRTIAIKCSDGPRRASAEPDAFPMAHGVPARVVKLRGGGNAIVPEVAAAFIQAAVEAIANHPNP